MRFAAEFLKNRIFSNLAYKKRNSNIAYSSLSTYLLHDILCLKLIYRFLLRYID